MVASTRSRLRRIAEYKTGVDFPVSLAISRSWWQLAPGHPEECLHLLEPYDFEDETEFSAYNPHNAFELKLTQASALSILGLNYRSQLRLVNSSPAATPKPACGQSSPTTSPQNCWPPK